MTLPLVAAALAYVVGSIPFGPWIARVAGGSDPRRMGSRSPGATNVLRAAGPPAAIATLLADAAKGAVAAIVAERFAGEGAGAWAAAAAVCGHAWPPWPGRTGGKGVATAAGAFVALASAPAAIAIGVFAVALAWGRFVSLASLLASASFPGAALLLGSSRPILAAGFVVAGVIAVRHRENVRRLRNGTEPKIGSAVKGEKA